jgi:hypothetical protein
MNKFIVTVAFSCVFTVAFAQQTPVVDACAGFTDVVQQLTCYVEKAKQDFITKYSFSDIPNPSGTPASMPQPSGPPRVYRDIALVKKAPPLTDGSNTTTVPGYTSRDKGSLLPPSAAQSTNDNAEKSTGIFK